MYLLQMGVYWPNFSPHYVLEFLSAQERATVASPAPRQNTLATRIKTLARRPEIRILQCYL